MCGFFEDEDFGRGTLAALLCTSAWIITMCRFQRMGGKRLRKKRFQLKEALSMVLTDPTERASLYATEDPSAIRDKWVAAVTKGIVMIQADVRKMAVTPEILVLKEAAHHSVSSSVENRRSRFSPPG